MLLRLAKWHSVALVLLAVFVVVVVLWPTEVPPQPGRLTEQPDVQLRGLPDTYEPERASFSVRFNDIETDLRLMSLFVMPGEVVDVSALGADTPVSLEADDGAIAVRGVNQWRWTSPDRPGLYRLRLHSQRVREMVTLKAFVKMPFHPDSLAINGYHIGNYERAPYRDNPFYTFPEGFVEVRPNLLKERVSPHFVLGQFVAKQVSSYPKYLLLHERLLLKLEMLLAIINRNGIASPTLHVMSGFRTPHYNRLIGNTTSYSVHLYGGAADVFVDTNDDSYMDDLDGDGDVDVDEARMLANLLEAEMRQPEHGEFVGGLGIYAPASHRGPFIHVDVRGEPARW